MQNYDWSQFTLRVPIRASVKDIYDAWTTQAGLEKWFLRKAEFTKPDKTIRDRNDSVQKDDVYEWKWYGYGDESTEKESVLETNGKDFFKFKFGKPGDVSISIKAEGEESIVELHQENIPTDEQAKINFHLGCTKGWVFYLVNLKSVLENG